MPRFLQTLAALAATLLLTPAALGQSVPALMPVQGYLSDDLGAPLNGVYELTLSLYTAETGGQAVYTEKQVVQVVAGRFSAHVGAFTSLDLSLFDTSSSIYLGMAVGSDPEMMPRFLLATVPYAAVARRAKDAATLGGLAASDFRKASQKVGWAELDGVPASIQDGDTLSKLSCTAGQVAKAGATGWSCGDDANSAGTITGVVAGSGLVGGGNSGAVTVSADSDYLQRRVVQSCSGAGISAIGDDGAVTCATESDPKVGGLVANRWCTANAQGTGLACAALQPAKSNQACSSGRVTGIDASGNLICSPKVGFLARRKTTHTWPDTGSEKQIPFDEEVYDHASNFDLAAGNFVAPVAGLYTFHASIMVEGVVAGDLIYVLIRAAGRSYYGSGGRASGTSMNTLHASATVYLDAGQSVGLFGYVQHDPPGRIYGNAASTYMFTYFQGALVE